MLLVGERYAFAVQKSMFWSAKNGFFGQKRQKKYPRNGFSRVEFTSLNAKFSLSARVLVAFSADADACVAGRAAARFRRFGLGGLCL